MAKGYWIGRVTVRDAEAYKAYVAANAETFRRWGARFVIRGAPVESVEGTARDRNVVIEFPSVEAARACWHSPEYQAARALRLDCSEADVIIVEGYEGPQP